MDFGSAASDYARHRRGFPPSFFDRLPLGGRVLDLGSGTGTLAAGYAARGADVLALDISHAMLRAAPGNFQRIVARAEACPFADGAFDAVVAGQCWHWFDGPAVARQCVRVLRTGGQLAIAHYDYLPDEKNVAGATEELILSFNPQWKMAGGDGRYEKWRPHLEGAGFADVHSFDYINRATYDHRSWRGRIRACNGVLALSNGERRDRIDDFDRALAAVLDERFPEPLVIPHRVFAIVGRKPI